jgi:hypothetical protein
MAGWSPASSNRASFLFRARSLFPFYFGLQLSICHRNRRTRRWCSSCSTALADELLLPKLRKLSPCRFSTMFAPNDLAARVLRILGDAELLPNTFGLPVAVEEIKLKNCYVIGCYYNVIRYKAELN